MEKLNSLLNKTIPDVLYHYTGGTAFLGMLTQKEMWASHIRFMNDLKEEILALEILNKKLTSQKEFKSNSNVDEIFNASKNFFFKETAEKGIFILSLSEKRDDLNQWRGYANGIPAYSIGFDTKKTY